MLSDIGIGPVGLTTFSKSISDMVRSKEMNLSTRLGFCETVSVRDGAATGIQIASGVCATVNGCWGKVQNVHSDGDVKLTSMWLDDGTLDMDNTTVTIWTL